MAASPDGGSPRHVPLGSEGWVGGDCYKADGEHDIESPGFLTERPAVLERIRQSRPHIHRYRECLAKHEASLGDGASPVGDRLEGIAALMYYGMRQYASHMWMSNAMWYSWAFNVLRAGTPAEGIPHGEEGRDGRNLVL